MARAATAVESQRRYIPAAGRVLEAIERWEAAFAAAEGTDYWSRENSDVGWAWKALESVVLEAPMVVHKHNGHVFGVWKRGKCGFALRRYEDRFAARR
jgi:hypothetical protein